LGVADPVPVHLLSIAQNIGLYRAHCFDRAVATKIA
jgi:hypothetical protein